MDLQLLNAVDFVQTTSTAHNYLAKAPISSEGPPIVLNISIVAVTDTKPMSSRTIFKVTDEWFGTKTP